VLWSQSPAVLEVSSESGGRERRVVAAGVDINVGSSMGSIGRLELIKNIEACWVSAVLV